MGATNKFKNFNFNMETKKEKLSFSAICVFAGSRPGTEPAFLESAKALGELFLKKNIKLVYGG